MNIDPQNDVAPSVFPIELLSGLGVRRFSFRKQIASTNSLALSHLAEPSIEVPWLIVAATQTAGRGRGENRWWSEEGSLTFSLVVDAEESGLRQAQWPRLSMAVGLAICQLLEREPWRLPVQLKWPNDVYVRGRKLGGILIEHLDKRLVIGIGLNVNLRFDGAPAEVRERASSLLLEMGVNCDTYALLIEVVSEVLAILPLVARDEVDFSHEAGERNYLQWKRVVIRQGITSIAGLCEGIDIDGALLVKTEAGMNRVLSGTVELEDK